MLKLVLGRAGSGKTRYVEDMFCSLAREGKEGLVLIVPEQFSFECERAFLRALTAKEAARIEVLSFSRIAEKLIDEYGIAADFIDRGKEAVAMSVALNGVEEELDIYSGKGDSLDFIRELVSFSGELKRGCVSSEKLLKISEEVGSENLKKKLRDLSIITGAYDAVTENTFYDSADKLDLLCELASKSGYFKGRTVAVDSFKGFTGQELEALRIIMRDAREVTVTLCCNGVGSRNEPFSLFYCVKRTLDQLLDMAKLENVTVEKPIELGDSPRFLSEELRALEEGLADPAAQVFEGECENVHISRAGDIYEECDHAAREIKSLLRDCGYRARETAVIYRDDSYAPIMAAALKNRGVPVFEDARAPYSVQPLLVFIKHAFSAARSGYSTEEILKYLKSGLAGLNTLEIAALENYVYVWGIDGAKWKGEWTGNPRGLEKMTDRDEAELRRINLLREKVVTPLRTFRFECADADAEKISKAVFRLLLEVGARENLRKIALSLQSGGENALAGEQELSWNFVMKILGDMVEIMGDRPISIKKYEQLFWFMVRSSDLGRLPSGLDEVELGNADRIRTVNPRAVFVLGLSDGDFPKVPYSGGLLTRPELRELDGTGTHVSDDEDYLFSQERFLVYTSLCCAREKVFLSYPERLLTGEEVAPSAAVVRVRNMFKNITVRDASGGDELDFISSRTDAFRLLAGRWRDNGALTYLLREYFNADSEYRPKLRAIERITDVPGFKFDDPSISRDLFGENMYISASKVENFYKCRFQYFCRYGMNVEGRRRAELDFMKAGTVVHYVMENVLKKYGRDELISAAPEQIRSDVDYYMNEYLEDSMGGAEGKSDRFMYLFRRLKVIIFSVVSRTVKEFSQSEFRFVDFELSIDRDGDIDPLTISLPDGGSVSVHGSVDRVDIMEKDGVSYVRVVDYKTGNKKFKLSDILSGVNLQMLIYLDCICKNGGERYGETVPAGVLYMLSQRDFKKSGESEKNTPMEGIVLDDVAVLRGMEKDLGGLYIPVKAGADKITGELISLEHMGKLAVRIENTLREMGELLHGGDVDDLPLRMDSRKIVCDYCDYRNICMHDSAREKNLLKLDNDKVFEILDGEMSNDGD